MDTERVQTWDDLAGLTALWNLASPSERLSAKEIADVCFDGAGVVLGDENAAIAALVGNGRGHIRLVAVRPEHRRRGLGLSLVRAAENWMRDRGANTATFGADIPYYLWPGIDAANLATLALAQRAGYRSTGCAINLQITTQCDPPGGVVRVGEQASEAVRDLITANWPAWLPEVELGMAQGTTFAVMDSGRAAGFCNHSSLRAGWIGPMGTDPRLRGHGVGRSLLAAVRRDLFERGFPQAQIAWVGPLGYFADQGATTSRVFCHYTRDL